ncbi:MAG: hypothetical protein P1V97_01535 [Planctomycetota bacterium]|nr:hypothetical protein [Planctomycetota bacterium]
MVDCTKRSQATTALGQKYGVSGYPTVVFTDNEGKVVEKLRSRAAAAVETQIKAVAAKYTKTPEKEIYDDPEEAIEVAKEKKVLVAIVFADTESKSKSTQKKNALIMETLKSDEMADLKPKFVWCVLPLKADKKKTDNAKEYKASSSGTFVIVDPTKEGKKRIIKKMSFSKSLKKNLQKILDKRG